jgi:hypothetical protein
MLSFGCSQPLVDWLRMMEDNPPTGPENFALRLGVVSHKEIT